MGRVLSSKSVPSVLSPKQILEGQIYKYAHLLTHTFDQDRACFRVKTIRQLTNPYFRMWCLGLQVWDLPEMEEEMWNQERLRKLNHIHDPGRSLATHNCFIFKGRVLVQIVGASLWRPHHYKNSLPFLIITPCTKTVYDLTQNTLCFSLHSSDPCQHTDICALYIPLNTHGPYRYS